MFNYFTVCDVELREGSKGSKSAKIWWHHLLCIGFIITDPSVRIKCESGLKYFKLLYLAIIMKMLIDRQKDLGIIYSIL